MITWAAACTEESGGRWVRPGPAPCTPAATPAAAAAWAPPRPSPPSPALAEGGAQPAQAPPPSPGRGVGGGAFSPAVAKVTVTSPGHRVRNVRAAVVAGKRRAGAQPGAGSEAVPGRQYALSWPAWLRASLCDSRGMPVPVLTHGAAAPPGTDLPSLSLPVSPVCLPAPPSLPSSCLGPPSSPCFADHCHNLLLVSGLSFLHPVCLYRLSSTRQPKL